MQDRLRLGISRCLLGDRVRYDGQHKLDRFITETLGRYVDFVPVCPEVECGLPVPREAMRLVGDPDDPRLMTQRTNVDLTEQMLTWARRRVIELEKEDLRGFIFKSKSPSSGMERVKVYNGRGGLSGRGPGMFAREFMRHFPLLPVEDEGRLNDPDLRENFIERVFTLQRYREATRPSAQLKNLMKFHEQHKLLIQSHSSEAARAMGVLLAGAGKKQADKACERYESMLLDALRLKATPKKHTNVLQHMLGHFKKHLTHDEKGEMLEIIGLYHDGLVPLIVPVTMFRHYVRKYEVPWLQGQYYLNPNPVELKLRNHA